MKRLQSAVVKMVGQNKIFAVALTVSVLFALSCTTVKENRGECPCYLTIDVDGYAALDDCPSALVQVQGTSLIRNTILPRDYESRGYEMKVERRPNRVTVLGGLEDSFIVGDTLGIDKWKEADPLMVFNAYVDCDGELAFEKAVPHKKWCEVYFILLGEESVGDYPYDMVLSADCNAMRITSGTPIWGDYKVLVERRKSGKPVARVPRQKENVLRLDFYTRNESRNYSYGDRVFSLDIGREMESRGYDWNREDLDDVNVFVDLARMKASVNIVEWETTRLNVEI